MNAIEKLSQTTPPAIAYATGNGQPLSYDILDFFTTISAQYPIDTLNLQTTPFISNDTYKLLIIAKPLLKFSDPQKLKIDQFILRGGKVIFFIDNVFAEMQQLEGNKKMIAQNIDLQLQDLLFHLGAKINYDLIQDLQCDRLPIQTGWNGTKPQFELLPWLYFPLLNPNQKHPITKNIDNVVAQFASSIDIVKNPNIKTTPLLTTSSQTKKIGTPSLVSFDILQNLSPKQFTSPNTFNVAVLLESQYPSLYANTITQDMQQQFQSQSHLPFLSHASKPSQIIIASDADIITNKITQKEGPLTMGTNPFTKFQFGNKIFLQNTIEFMCSQTGIIENRNKNFALRILDKRKIDQEKTFWQGFNLFIPLLITLLLHSLYAIWRWQKYHQQ